MLRIGERDAVNLLRFFDDLPDPRSEVNRLHRLGDVIAIAVCAVMAMADGPTAIASWAKLNEPWLRKHLALPSGIPGKDTFRRVLGLLNPAAFQQCFQQWLESLSVPLGQAAQSLADTFAPHLTSAAKSLTKKKPRSETDHQPATEKSKP